MYQKGIVMKINVLLTTVLLLSVDTLWANKEKVTFYNGDIKLSGTLYTPKGEGPHPAIIFVHGSGPELGKNSSYSAKWLASIGYVALSYDKRGVGDSGGTEDLWRNFNFGDLADDALAAARFLESKSFVDSDAIGLHATSQGGWVAALASSKSNLISFMIIKSASVCTVEEDRISERAARLTSEGFAKKDLEEVQQMQKTEPYLEESDSFQTFWEQFITKPWFRKVYAADTPESLVNYRKWYATIAYFDPVEHLNEVEIPIYWIFGNPELDQMGPVTQSIENVNNLKNKGRNYVVLQVKDQGHNIKESAYEKPLYDWLLILHGERGYPFKKH